MQIFIYGPVELNGIAAVIALQKPVRQFIFLMSACLSAPPLVKNIYLIRAWHSDSVTMNRIFNLHDWYLVKSIVKSSAEAEPWLWLWYDTIF